MSDRYTLAALETELHALLGRHDDGHPLARLVLLRETRRILRHDERRAALMAQRAGYGCETIGRCLGISRATAWRRHGATTPRPRTTKEETWVG